MHHPWKPRKPLRLLEFLARFTKAFFLLVMSLFWFQPVAYADYPIFILWSLGGSGTGGHGGCVLYPDPGYPFTREFCEDIPFLDHTVGVFCESHGQVVKDQGGHGLDQICIKSYTCLPGAIRIEGVGDNQVCITEDSYIVKLTQDTGETETDTILISVEPKDSKSPDKNIANLIAQVFDENNELVPDVEVMLKANALEGTGGHSHHDATRPSGTLAPLAPSQGTVTEDGAVLTGNTDAEGLRFTFTAPAPAGDHELTASCTDQNRTCTQEGPEKVWVGIKDLISIPLVPSSLPFATYELFEATGKPIGQTDRHLANHYLTERAILKLWNLGFRYSKIEFPKNPKLHINDASLERGGLFDIKGKWKPKHHEHRRGTVVDVRANLRKEAIPENAFDRFDEIANILGIHARIHFEFDKAGKPVIETRHYHIRLLGRAE